MFLWNSHFTLLPLRVKVIPLFCTAHPLLCIILWHPRWRQFFPLAQKEQTRAAFAELKLLFPIIMNRSANSVWFAIEKQENGRNACVSEVCSGFLFAAVELWNYYINVLAEALDGGCEAFGTALQLSNCIKEPVSGLGLLLYICRSNSKCGETNMSGTNKTQQKHARETNVWCKHKVCCWIYISLCTETKQAHIWRIGIKSLFFKFFCQALLRQSKKIEA